MEIIKSDKPTLSFDEKLAIDTDAKSKFDAVNEALLNKVIDGKAVKELAGKKGVRYRVGLKTVAFVMIVGKTLRVYFALDPKSEDFAKIPHKDASDKKAYADVPFLMKLSSDLAVKRAIKLIEVL